MNGALLRVPLLLALASIASITAQSLSAPALKAVLLYNFTKFAEWPPDAIAPAASLELCVADAPDVADALQNLVEGQTVGDHPLNVRRVKRDGGIRDCHMFYAAGLDHRACLELLDTVKGLPVLTITDNVEFAALGGHVNLFFDHDRIRFSINLEATGRSRVKLSSKLLALATIVKDRPPAR